MNMLTRRRRVNQITFISVLSTTAIAFDEASRRGVGLVALHAWSDLRVSDLKELFPNFDWDTHLSEEEETLAERLAGWQQL